MKKIVFALLIAAGYFCQAQKITAQIKTGSFMQSRTSEMIAAPYWFGGNESSLDQNIQQYFKTTLAQLANPLCGLKFQSKQVSPLGIHYTYVQTYNGKEILGSELKVNMDKNGHLLCAFNGLFMLPLNTPATTNGIWFFDGNNLQAASVEINNNQSFVKSETGELLYTEDLNKYLFPPDTSVQAKVFFPDPLTSAQVAYGSPYVDSNDADLVVLNAQRKQVSLKVSLVNDTFRLTNQYFQLSEYSSPVFEPVTVTSPLFDFTRSQSGFEDVNIFYHLNRYRNHVDSIGYGLYVSDSMQVDAHALGSSDNSMFSSYNGKPAMYYGVGGIDDGEDADVVVHEYTHSIIGKAAVTDNVSQERQAIDEAVCDYMAAAYSKNISLYNWKHLYNWDGNNAALQWYGRDAGSNKTYPYNGAKDYYWNSEIFSSTLADLDDRIGSVLTERLLLGSIASMSRTVTMKQMCALMLITDSLMFANAYHFPVQLSFYDRKIITQMTNVRAFETQALHILNAESFARGTGDLAITYDGATEVSLSCFDITGHEVMKEKTFISQAIVSPDLFAAGVYIMHLSVNGMVHSFKVIRY